MFTKNFIKESLLMLILMNMWLIFNIRAQINSFFFNLIFGANILQNIGIRAQITHKFHMDLYYSEFFWQLSVLQNIGLKYNLSLIWYHSIIIKNRSSICQPISFLFQEQCLQIKLHITTMAKLCLLDKICVHVIAIFFYF